MSTDAGKQAVKLRGLFGGETEVRAAAWVGMIEAEAAAAERARIAAAVLTACDQMDAWTGGNYSVREVKKFVELLRAAVLAIVEEP